MHKGSVMCCNQGSLLNSVNKYAQKFYPARPNYLRRRRHGRHMQTDSMSCIDEVRILHDTVAIVLQLFIPYVCVINNCDPETASFVLHRARIAWIGLLAIC